MKIQLHLLLYFPLATSMSSTPPAKKRVGRPTKLYTSDQVRNMIAKYHDIHEMVDFSEKYGQLFKIHCKSSVSVIVRPSTKTRRSFTQKKKEEVRLIIPLVEIILKQREHLILINQHSEELLMLHHYQIKWSSWANTIYQVLVDR